ncbi:hypothetical protein [uncultured Alistipes sp.]|jgi:hypothetical protein|uniref:hypothetical protein n=1 Tax=uncultured Alistipes sp. TaxID=538949 RepID=UPI00260148BF|nr:hypothetical protein [uncultured Alistipes sp.]
MKRTLLLALAALFIISCEGPEGPAGRPGQDGRDGIDGQGVSWYTTAITVHESEWKIKGNPGDLNSYFYVYKRVNNMTREIYEKGSVIAYLEIESGVKNGMPYVLHMGEESGGKEFLWTQTYDYDFDDQGVGFYVTYSDFNTQIKPGTETFHIVLMW